MGTGSHLTLGHAGSEERHVHKQIDPHAYSIDNKQTNKNILHRHTGREKILMRRGTSSAHVNESSFL